MLAFVDNFLQPSEQRNVSYAYLKTSDKGTGITLLSDSSEEVETLSKKVHLLSSGSSYLAFEIIPTKDLPTTRIGAPLPYCFSSSLLSRSKEGKNWLGVFCKQVCLDLYHQAEKEERFPPYPFFSATHRGWLEANLDEPFCSNSRALRLHLKAKESSKDQAREIDRTLVFLRDKKIDPITLKSCSHYLSTLKGKLSAEEIEISLSTRLNMGVGAPIDDTPPQEAAGGEEKEGETEMIFDLEEVIQLSAEEPTRSIETEIGPLEAELRKLNQDSKSEEVIPVFADILNTHEFSPETLTKLYRDLSAAFPSLTPENVKKLMDEARELQDFDFVG